MLTTNPPYTDEQRKEYLLMSMSIGMKWLFVFDKPSDDKTFWDTGYWDLLSKLWEAGGMVKKTDATAFISGKTTPTAIKYINLALEEGLIEEIGDESDSRLKMVGLSEKTKQRIDDFLDSSLDEAKRTIERVLQ